MPSVITLGGTSKTTKEMIVKSEAALEEIAATVKKVHQSMVNETTISQVMETKCRLNNVVDRKREICHRIFDSRRGPTPDEELAGYYMQEINDLETEEIDLLQTIAVLKEPSVDNTPLQNNTTPRNTRSGSSEARYLQFS